MPRIAWSATSASPTTLRASKSGARSPSSSASDALTRPGRQIGHYRPSGDVETNASRISNNVQLLAESIVLNYMALHDDVGRFASALPMHGLGTGAQLDALIGFAPIRPTPP